MNTKHVLGAVAAAAFAVLSHSAIAQPSTSGTPTNSGSLAPAGQGPGAQVKPNTMSDKSRMDRKETTKAAVKSGMTQPAGEAPRPEAESQKPRPLSDTAAPKK